MFDGFLGGTVMPIIACKLKKKLSRLKAAREVWLGD